MPSVRTSDLDEVFFALSDGTRRSIIRELAKGEATVGQLVAPFDLAPATLSKHIRVLARAGLVEQRRDGRHLRTRLKPAPLWESAGWLNDMRALWSARLDALEDLLKRERPSRGR